VRSGLERIEAARPELRRPDASLQAAIVVLDPRTGEILAMVGGRDYGASQFNRAVHAHRQPGSSFKPIVALAALSRGGGFTLASRLADEPLAVETRAGLWRPANYDGSFRGEVSLREALERSLNVPFARLGIQIGPERVVATARRLGIQSWLNAVPSIALGSFEMTPLEMTRAFGVLAANGFRAESHATLGVLDATGGVLSRFELEGEQVYTPAETYLVTSALQGAVERGTGRALRALGYRGPVAAKSGTTNDTRDAWFIGYTPSIAVGVWVGFDDARTTGLSGSSVALPIFASFLTAALGVDGDGDFSFPNGLEMAVTNGETGLRSGFYCGGESEVFLRGTAPPGSCRRYRYAASGSGRSRRYSDRARALADAPRRRSRRSGRP
jgi:penicillin-binding protein 1B